MQTLFQHPKHLPAPSLTPTGPKLFEADLVNHFCDVLRSVGYVERKREHFNIDLGFDTELLHNAIKTINPQGYKKLHPAHTGTLTFPQRLAQQVRTQINSFGSSALSCLQKGIDLKGTRLYLLDATQPNAPTELNTFSFIRELNYTRLAPQDYNRLDLVIFVNGIPLYTFEFKYTDTDRANESTDADAMTQYRTTRTWSAGQEPLLHPSQGALAHFALSNLQAQFTTHLNGPKTDFLPFNIGHRKNEYTFDAIVPNPKPNSTDHPLQVHPLTANSPVLQFIGWIPSHTLNPHTLLPLLTTFLSSRKDGHTIHPRIHQLLAVNQAIIRTSPSYSKKNKPTLFNHSAGSGKTLTIAWTAKSLSKVIDGNHPRFDLILIVNTRTVLDSQTADTFNSIANAGEQLRDISTIKASSAKDLVDLVHAGHKVITTTLQKLAHLKDPLLASKRILVLIDEAHMGQSGKQQQAASALLDSSFANPLPSDPNDPDNLTSDDLLTEDIFSPNISYIAFTATPTERIRQLFGEPAHSYTMVQSQAEGMTLNPVKQVHSVILIPTLQALCPEKPIRYTGPATFLPFIEKNPTVQRHIANDIVKRLQLLNPLNAPTPSYKKGIALFGSRLEAVLYNLLLNYAFLQDYTQQQTSAPSTSIQRVALIAFSGTIQLSEDQLNALPELKTLGFLPNTDYTEKTINNTFLPQSLHNLEPKTILTTLKATPDLANFTPTELKATPRAHTIFPLILCLANKYQVGFDEPDLCALFLAKSLQDANAVQALSRINRRRADKTTASLAVYDYAGMANSIKDAFATYSVSVPDFHPDYVLQKLEKAWSTLYSFLEPEIDDALLVYSTSDETDKHSIIANLYTKAKQRSADKPRGKSLFNSCQNDFFENYARLQSFVKPEDAKKSALYPLLPKLLPLLRALRAAHINQNRRQVPGINPLDDDDLGLENLRQSEYAYSLSPEDYDLVQEMEAPPSTASMPVLDPNLCTEEQAVQRFNDECAAYLMKGLPSSATAVLSAPPAFTPFTKAEVRAIREHFAANVAFLLDTSLPLEDRLNKLTATHAHLVFKALQRHGVSNDTAKSLYTPMYNYSSATADPAKKMAAKAPLSALLHAILRP